MLPSSGLGSFGRCRRRGRRVLTPVTEVARNRGVEGERGEKKSRVEEVGKGGLWVGTVDL